MYLYGHSDRDWLFLLFSYSGLVNCMDKKCHEIVYMKLWPNMNSKLWKCTILTDFRVYHHIPTHLCYSWPHHPLKLTKKAWWCAKPACCANYCPEGRLFLQVLAWCAPLTCTVGAVELRQCVLAPSSSWVPSTPTSSWVTSEHLFDVGLHLRFC